MDLQSVVIPPIIQDDPIKNLFKRNRLILLHGDEGMNFEVIKKFLKIRN